MPIHACLAAWRCQQPSLRFCLPIQESNVLQKVEFNLICHKFNTDLVSFFAKAGMRCLYTYESASIRTSPMLYARLGACLFACKALRKEGCRIRVFSARNLCSCTASAETKKKFQADENRHSWAIPGHKLMFSLGLYTTGSCSHKPQVHVLTRIAYHT